MGFFNNLFGSNNMPDVGEMSTEEKERFLREIERYQTEERHNAEISSVVFAVGLRLVLVFGGLLWLYTQCHPK